MKPRGMIATTSAMALLNLGGLVGVQWSHRSVVVAIFVLILCGYIVLWYYWQGRNWARILVVLTSAVAVFDVSTIRRPYGSVLYNSLIVVEAALGLFLLYWLNTKSVSNWFMRRRTDAPLEQGP